MSKELTHVYQIVKESIESNKAVVRIQTEVPADVVMTGFELDGYTAIIVDQAPVFNKFTLLHALYQSCSLPAYFGFNWDALNDVLVTLDDGVEDAESIDAPPPSGSEDEEEEPETSEGVMLIFNDFGILEERAEDVAATFLDIVEEAAQKRTGSETTPLKVIVLSAVE